MIIILESHILGIRQVRARGGPEAKNAVVTGAVRASVRRSPIGWGRIVNISSSSTHSGTPYMTHYAAAKSPVNGLTKSLALE
jgi:NAD(P)-dependent dehydrogenase (short-subunit alcohol dehydrogenase family)